ncbi:MAG: 1-(5-phosphoribosyl)-5-[(5-phosphoribosylamino)methylideneamino]imidazole-4-carboxamide isomerase [Methylophilaceae bacterium]|nr:1-(5-phosphoribosyl)-5-[(5-phosphoribosylamino)methylideneamino]imidazole-4-carboxamide isomerase [Methylophilaceae bacterium]MBL6726386.1 1-(5-phosphoribosyl)-5-[(5-phosphoribosylamino)methylideneamino]imidazole-4-carboxamide isomerase [Methylophilaceae bacterium]MBL6728516.1 1-(5-phosphoribosyl)-5-[(5-phosphoribosylamino)methylideneamino]imidazole-4-carboxamide isomerase [Methylophilaceae bacterium]MBL6790651.1 1-(5-phosphoribosyl)-5-[(5-phosphoribosylamino)methylideneamino]imidazole-4-carb
MLIIPAIDLKEGKCVRLKQGLMDQSTIFSEHPAETAKKWFDLGARRLHLVDLDGAFSGKPMNLNAIKEIISEIGQKIPIQLGGGIRSLDTIEKFLESGLDSVIIGTAAITQPGFLHEACYAFPGQIMVGLDAKDGDVAINGWAKLTGHNVIDLAQKFEEYGVESIIYTDIGRDGMLSGVNIEATVKLTEAVSVPVVASGGVTNLKDIEALCEVSNIGIRGVITGRAIYEGTLNFEEAQQLADKLAKPL